MPVLRSTLRSKADCHNSMKAQQAQSRQDKQQIKTLERELRRKERALAETAALLVLRKKANAIWGEGEDE